MANLERNTLILNYLKEKKSASVEELARHLFVSEATIRRDLTEMQKLGQIERSHGGAMLMENAEEISIFIRLEKNAKEKEKTASIALKYIPDFKTVFIDNSSTCLALAERMNLSHKTVVTNGLQIAAKLSQKDNVQILMPGGSVLYNTNSVMGSMAIDGIKHFRFDLMLSSCAALDESGSYENSVDTATLKRVAIMQSKKRILLADSSKIGNSAMFCTCSLANYDLIVTNANDELVQQLHYAGVRVTNKYKPEN